MKPHGTVNLAFRIATALYHLSLEIFQDNVACYTSSLKTSIRYSNGSLPAERIAAAQEKQKPGIARLSHLARQHTVFQRMAQKQLFKNGKSRPGKPKAANNHGKAQKTQKGVASSGFGTDSCFLGTFCSETVFANAGSLHKLAKKPAARQAQAERKVSH